MHSELLDLAVDRHLVERAPARADPRGTAFPVPGPVAGKRRPHRRPEPDLRGAQGRRLVQGGQRRAAPHQEGGCRRIHTGRTRIVRKPVS